MATLVELFAMVILDCVSDVRDDQCFYEIKRWSNQTCFYHVPAER